MWSSLQNALFAIPLERRTRAHECLAADVRGLLALSFKSVVAAPLAALICHSFPGLEPRALTRPLPPTKTE
eukprot:974860-Amphidinium_carterae.1